MPLERSVAWHEDSAKSIRLEEGEEGICYGERIGQLLDVALLHRVEGNNVGGYVGKSLRKREGLLKVSQDILLTWEKIRR